MLPAAIEGILPKKILQRLLVRWTMLSSSFACYLQVTYAKGWGSIKGPNEVEVALLDGGKQTLSTKNILIATGSEVTPLQGVPVDEER